MAKILNSTNGFSIKSFVDTTLNFVYTKSLSSSVVECLWSKKAPPRAEMLTRFLVKEKLKTREYMLNLGLIQNEQALCTFCNNTIKSTSHLFFTCLYSWNFWTSCFSWRGVSTVLHYNPSMNIEDRDNIIQGLKFTKNLC